MSDFASFRLRLRELPPSLSFGGQLGVGVCCPEGYENFAQGRYAISITIRRRTGALNRLPLQGKSVKNILTQGSAKPPPWAKFSYAFRLRQPVSHGLNIGGGFVGQVGVLKLFTENWADQPKLVTQTTKVLPMS